MPRDPDIVAAPDRELVRIAMCGSVDSGKSSLLGRLVVDAGLAFDDEGRRDGRLDLALLADGLEAESEQGITIDVAHRHLFTPRRSYLIADAPGHQQYTRNMATAASLARIAVVLVDAVEGVEPQTLRHLAICAVMGVDAVIVAVNKMDAVAWDRDRFAVLADAMRAHAAALGIGLEAVLPISALAGGNVTERAADCAWHAGPTLVEALDAVEVPNRAAARPVRLPVRYVLREDDGTRWLAGTIASGTVERGMALGIAGRPQIGGAPAVVALHDARGAQERAVAGTAVRLRLAGDVDASRGDVLCDPADVETGLASAASARLVWMGDEPLAESARYVVRAGTRWMFARVAAVDAVLDLETLRPGAARPVEPNDIADVRLEFAQPIPLDAFADHRETGALILVDPATNATVGAALVTEAVPARRAAIREGLRVTRAEREALNGHRGLVVWLTGLPASGKSTITREVEGRLHGAGYQVFVVDGDNLRQGLTGDLGFSPDDRTENIRRAAEVARLLLEAGQIVLCEFVSPMQIDRDEARRIVGAEDFAEVHVAAPLEVCVERDPKGLYRRALAGELPDFTGVSSPYEPPASPALVLDTALDDLDACAARVVDLVERRIAIDASIDR